MAREIGEKNYPTGKEGRHSRMCCLPLSRLFSSISHKRYCPNSILLASISPQSDYPDLNDEMIEEILGRLPLPSLLRAKTICKAWNTAISSPNFNAHEDRGINNQYFVAQVDDENLALFSIALNRWFQIPLFTTTDGLGRRVCAAEAEGLYLFVVWQNYKDSMIIVNPATKQQRLLPHLPNKWNKMAVELVAHSDHIEIIAFGFDKREPLYLCALIYNSFTNKWKNVPLMRDAVHFRSRHGIYGGTSVLHNGVVYIVTFSCTHLARYDIKSQEFQFRRIVGRLPERCFHCYSTPSIVSCGGKFLLVLLLRDGSYYCGAHLPLH